MIRALLLWLLLVPLAAAAQSIYKWVDEKGVTHFSESPPPDGKATKVEVKPTGTEKPRVDNWKERELESRQRRVQKEGAEEENLRKQESERTQRCSHAREALDTVKNSRRIYRLDDKGERVYMEDKDRPEAIEKWSREVERYCR
ncbi:MAG: DUF4124 domain-containing protein [Usitatibacter sp.]